jgi:hypothetical protein
MAAPGDTHHTYMPGNHCLSMTAKEIFIQIAWDSAPESEKLLTIRNFVMQA